MPYFVFRMSPEKHLDLLNEFDSFRDAKVFARDQRAALAEQTAEGEEPTDTVKMCHASSEPHARMLLTAEREPRPMGEDA